MPATLNAGPRAAANGSASLVAKGGSIQWVGWWPVSGWLPCSWSWWWWVSGRNTPRCRVSLSACQPGHWWSCTSSLASSWRIWTMITLPPPRLRDGVKSASAHTGRSKETADYNFLLTDQERESEKSCLFNKTNKGALIAGNKINGYSRRLHWPWTCCSPRWAITIQESL